MSDDIQTGERLMRSPITNTWYLVTKWRDKGVGKAQAIEKRELDEDEVDEYIDKLDGNEP